MGVTHYRWYKIMSLTASQLYEKIDECCGTNSTSFSLAKKAVAINLALDEAMATIFQLGGTWQFDDGNHAADPIITTNLVANQRDYHFTVDEQSNMILDILRVQVKDASGVFHDLDRVDMQRNGPTTLTDGQSSTGVPTKYALTGNGIFLDLVPSYSSTGGLRVFINRQASYFISSDTTKVAGIDGLCHDFLYLKPAYEYARDKGLAIREALFRDLDLSMQKIKNRYKTKERDVSKRMTPNYQNNH
jgi:hypothetical protein